MGFTPDDGKNAIIVKRYTDDSSYEMIIDDVWLYSTDSASWNVNGKSGSLSDENFTGQTATRPCLSAAINIEATFKYDTFTIALVDEADQKRSNFVIGEKITVKVSERY